MLFSYHGKDFEMKYCFRILVLGVCAALVLCACSSVHRLTVNDNDTYTDRSTRVTYVPMSACYEPLSLGAEYASFKRLGVTTMLYTVGDYAPEQVLASAYYGVYRAEELVLPTFEKMDLTAMRVYAKATPTIPVYTVEKGKDDNTAIIEAIANAYQNGTRVTYPSFYTQKAAYTLRFEASNLPDLCFCISYIEYAEDIYDEIDGEEVNLGRYFLYDRYNKVCVSVDGALHDLIEG
jgi:hypothetical protein